MLPDFGEQFFRDTPGHQRTDSELDRGFRIQSGLGLWT